MSDRLRDGSPRAQRLSTPNVFTDEALFRDFVGAADRTPVAFAGHPPGLARPRGLSAQLTGNPPVESTPLDSSFRTSYLHGWVVH